MPPIQDHLLPAVPTSPLLLGNHHRLHSQKVRRRRKMPSIRLGGRRARRGAYLVRTFRKVRLRFPKLYYFRMLKRLRSFYDGVARELAAAAGGAMDAVQSRIMMESYGAVAFVPITSLTSGYVR